MKYIIESSMGYHDIIIAFSLVSFVLFCYFFRAKGGMPTNWPFVGMLIALVKNRDRFHEFLVHLMNKSQMTFLIKGPWFSNLNFIVTVDPANINHVFSRNFKNYDKGPTFHEIFKVVGDGIFNVDGNLWKYQRNLNHSFFTQPKFKHVLVNTIQDEIKSSLFPLFDHVSKSNVEIDLQDVFQRFTYDIVFTIIINHNPKFLSIDLTPILFPKAIKDFEEVVFKCHLLPVYMWKFLRWLGVDKEEYSLSTVDDYLYKLIAKKREDRSSTKSNVTKDDVEVSYDLLTSCMDDEEQNGTIPNNRKGEKFLRDTILNLIIAGADSTNCGFSWFFYILMQYPEVKIKIREEINTIMIQNKETLEGLLSNFNAYNNEFVYLHAAICETLRLYPPAPYNHKASIEKDVLPSGHKLSPHMHIIFDLYAMGRMKSIWGDDCDEFKPERWIAEDGSIKIEPSYKFLSFGAGPRICQGKDMALTELKVVIISVILKYDIELVEGHPVMLGNSIVLYMKHGLRVKIKHLTV